MKRAVLLLPFLFMLSGCVPNGFDDTNLIAVQTRGRAVSVSTKPAAEKAAAKQAEAERRYAEKRNLLLTAAFLIAVLAFGLFRLIKRRYDSNLKKYFEEKERRERMRLAENIIDKIADGGTPSAPQRKLIETLRGISEESPPQKGE